jgi:hypothetical protein
MAYGATLGPSNADKSRAKTAGNQSDPLLISTMSAPSVMDAVHRIESSVAPAHEAELEPEVDHD